VIGGKIGMVQVEFTLWPRPMPFFMDEKSTWNLTFAKLDNIFPVSKRL